MMADAHIDISEILRIELNNAIIKQIKTNPSARVLNIDEVSIEDLEKYLSTTNVILWANWIISDSDGANKAAQWIKNVLDELYVYLSNRQ